MFCGAVLLPLFQNYIGMASLQDGIDYYSEVHTNMWTHIIHTLYMPWLAYGCFCIFSGLFCHTGVEAIQGIHVILCFYIGHYTLICPIYAILIYILYSYPALYAAARFHRFSPYNSEIVSEGALIVIGALVMQEYGGHYLSGDPPSRLEAIPNAILYAPYYTVNYF